MNDFWKIHVSTKYRICCKVHDLGSEWSCSLSTTVMGGFQILSAIVSTDTHNSNPWFCIYLEDQFDINTCTLFMVDFFKMQANKFPLLPLICLVHAYLNPLTTTIPFALELCCFERIMDTLLYVVNPRQLADGVGSNFEWLLCLWHFSAIRCGSCNIIRGKDTELIYQCFPKTCICGFKFIIWYFGWSCCLLRNMHQVLFCKILVCSHQSVMTQLSPHWSQCFIRYLGTSSVLLLVRKHMEP